MEVMSTPKAALIRMNTHELEVFQEVIRIAMREDPDYLVQNDVMRWLQEIEVELDVRRTVGLE